MINLSELTISEVQSAYLAGEYSARKLVQAYFDRIKAIDENGPRLNSILTVSPFALNEADHLDAYLKLTGKLKGPLHGIPTIVKDQIETKGIRTTFGSIAAKDHLPDQDATLIRNLKRSGAIIIAKSTMPDWALSWFSTSSLSTLTRNPYCLSRDPGGSSSGTGAAISSNLAVLGIGGDTGGSIRIPSSFCNLVGLRCTPGLISRKGMSALVVSQDTAGPMCRTVTDAAILLDSLVGYDPEDPYTATAAIAHVRSHGTYAHDLEISGPALIRTARLGVLRKQCFGPDSDPDCHAVNAVIDNALKMLVCHGAELIEVEIPDLEYYCAVTSVYGSRSRNDLDKFLETMKKESGFAPTTIADIVASEQYPLTSVSLRRIASGPTHPHQDPDYLKRVEERDVFQRLLVGILASNKLNALLFPTCQIPPPLSTDGMEGGKWTQNPAAFPTNTHIASLGWMPSISVPVGLTGGSSSEDAIGGLPVGLEMLALPYREQELLTLAKGVETFVKGRREPQLA